MEVHAVNIERSKQSMSKAKVAYDYTAQRWVVGVEAAQVRAEQIGAELLILRSGKAAEYLAFVGSTLTPAQAVTALEAELRVIVSH